MRTRIRLHAALAVVTAALGLLALPTVASYADTSHLRHLPPDAPHRTPREEIQPAAIIVGETARRIADRALGNPLNALDEHAESILRDVHAPAADDVV